MCWSTTARWARRFIIWRSPPEDYGGVAQDGCPEILAIAQPDAIRGIHRAFLAAGADVLETDTFGGSRLKLDEYGLGARTLRDQPRRRAARARGRRRFSTPEQPRFVAGSMGPTGMLPSSDDPTLSQHHLRRAGRDLREQARRADRGRRRPAADRDQPGHPGSQGGDRRASTATSSETRPPVPIQAQVTLDTSGRMLLGTDIAARADHARGAAAST